MGRFSCKTAARPCPRSCPPASGEPPSPGHVFLAARKGDKSRKGRALPLFLSILVSFRLHILSSSLSHPLSPTFLLFLPCVCARFLLSICFYFHRRGRGTEGPHGSTQPITRVFSYFLASNTRILKIPQVPLKVGNAGCKQPKLLFPVVRCLDSLSAGIISADFK